MEKALIEVWIVTGANGEYGVGKTQEDAVADSDDCEFPVRVDRLVISVEVPGVRSASAELPLSVAGAIQIDSM